MEVKETKVMLENYLNRVFLDNCINVLPEIPDRSIDLILTDPPYGLGYGKYDDANNFYDAEKELYRILKEDSFLVFFWSVKKIPEIMKKLVLFKYKWQIICQFPKTYSKCFLGDRTYMPVFVYAKGDPHIVSKARDNVVASELPFVVGKVKNPLFKPTLAVAMLLYMFSKENDLVLDPFCGFGSIPFVCKQFNRNFIGIDINERCIDFANKFLNEGRITQIGNGRTIKEVTFKKIF